MFRQISALNVSGALFVAPAALGLLWASTSVTLSSVATHRHWTISVPGLPRSADMLADAAARTLNEGAFHQGEAGKLAERALSREPINVVAARTWALATADAVEPNRTTRAFNYAESLSRRDMATQLWLIEDAVRTNDIDRALAHYDIGLRTVETGSDVLYDRVVAAADDPSIRTKLAKLMAKRPIWWYAMAIRIAKESKAPKDTISSVFAALKLRANNKPDDELLSLAIGQLLLSKEYASAAKFYRGTPALLKNGDFEQSNPQPPFDWLLASDEGPIATILSRHDERGNALFIDMSSESDRPVASQLTILPAGRYKIGALVHGGPQPSLTMTPLLLRVSCADGLGRGQMLGDFTIPAIANANRNINGSFDVPRGCSGQWVDIIVRGTQAEFEGDFWIDHVTIRTIAH